MGFDVERVRLSAVNVYLIKGDRLALVDTGMKSSYRKLFRELWEAGIGPKDIDFILMTHHHMDHAGNLARLKALSGATVIAGEADAPVIEGERDTPLTSRINATGRLLSLLPDSLVRWYQSYERVGVDRKVSGGEVIEELGLEVVPLPGHTPGGVGYLDREGRRAFVGDLVSYFMGRPGMPALSASESLEEIFDSQERLAGLDLEVAYPGHGRVMKPGASKLIGDYTRKKRARAR